MIKGLFFFLSLSPFIPFFVLSCANYAQIFNPGRMSTKVYFVSIVLDTRYKKKSGKYPVKLQIFESTTGDRKYFALKSRRYEFTDAEYKQVMEAKRPKGDAKQIKDELERIRARAEEQTTKPGFSIRDYRPFGKPKASGETVAGTFEGIIKRLEDTGRIRTAISYTLALKSIIAYNRREGLKWNDITPDWLNGYESWMQEQGRSLTTVGIYLRALRSAFNEEIQAGRLPQASYPFGRRKYVIPAGSAVKKALTKDQLKTLVQTPLEPGSYQHKARAFWLFSLLTNGMNFLDIAKLKYKDIDGDEIVFLRTKTKNTTKAKMKPIQAFLAPQAREVIEMYGNASREPENYVFPILAPGMDEKEIIKTAQNFTRLTNQHLKKLAKNIGIPDAISTNWARHTFATLSVIGGAPLEFVGAALGHENTKTTQNYFAGFPSETRRQVSEGLMQFD